MAQTGLGNMGVFLANTDTTPIHDLGTISVQNGNEYVYIRAGSAIALGDVLVIDTTATDEPYRLIPTSALNQSIEAIAQVAIASGSFGWVCARGNVVAKVAASTAANVAVGTSATAGTFTTITVSASPTQAEVQRVLAAAVGRGVITLDAESGGLAEVYIK
jgi:hypothetical protein